MIGGAYEQLVDWTRISKTQQVQWRDCLRADSAYLEECLGEAVGRVNLVNSVAAGFSDVLKCELVHDKVRFGEWERSLERAVLWNLGVEVAG